MYQSSLNSINNQQIISSVREGESARRQMFIEHIANEEINFEEKEIDSVNQSSHVNTPQSKINPFESQFKQLSKLSQSKIIDNQMQVCNIEQPSPQQQKHSIEQVDQDNEAEINQLQPQSFDNYNNRYASLTPDRFKEQGSSIQNINQTKPIIVNNQQSENISNVKEPNEHDKSQQMQVIDDIKKLIDYDDPKAMAEYDIHQKKKPLAQVWKKMGLIILYLIRKFSTKMKHLSTTHRFKTLKKLQFQIINDQSTQYKYYVEKGMLSDSLARFLEKMIYSCKNSKMISQIVFENKYSRFCSRVICHNIQQFMIFMPDSKIRVIWDFFLALTLLFNMFYIPIQIAFSQLITDDSYFSNDSGNPLSFVLRLMLGLNIFFNFNTAYYKKGTIVIKRLSIIYHYLKHSLIYDCFVFIILLVNMNSQYRFLSVIILLHYSRVLQIFNKISDYLSLNNFQTAIYDLFKLIYLILFIANLCACGFYVLHEFELSSFGLTTTWMTKLNLTQSEWHEHYLAALYWAVITMITVGYGDISAVTTNERIYIIFITFIACGVFAYAVNQIGTIVQSIANINAEFRSKMRLLTMHMRKRGMPIELQMKVKKYFEYIYVEKQSDNELGEQLLQNLSGSLKNEVFEDIYNRILSSKKLFYLNFSSEFIKKLSLKMKEKRLNPEEIIFNQKEIVDSLYILMKGEVNLFVPIKKQRHSPYTVVQTLHKGDVVGELNFFSGQATQLGAISKNVVSLVYVTKMDFMECILQFQEDFEKFHVLKDNVNIYNSSWGLAAKCSSCFKYSHQITHCPFVQFVPLRQSLLAKYHLDDKPQNRVPHEREQHKFISTRANIEILKESAIQYLIDNSENMDIQELMLMIENMNKEQSSQVKSESRISPISPTLTHNSQHSNKPRNQPTQQAQLQLQQSQLQQQQQQKNPIQPLQRLQQFFDKMSISEKQSEIGNDSKGNIPSENQISAEQQNQPKSLIDGVQPVKIVRRQYKRNLTRQHSHKSSFLLNQKGESQLSNRLTILLQNETGPLFQSNNSIRVDVKQDSNLENSIDHNQKGQMATENYKEDLQHQLTPKKVQFGNMDYNKKIIEENSSNQEYSLDTSKKESDIQVFAGGSAKIEQRRISIENSLHQQPTQIKMSLQTKNILAQQELKLNKNCSLEESGNYNNSVHGGGIITPDQDKQQSLLKNQNQMNLSTQLQNINNDDRSSHHTSKSLNRSIQLASLEKIKDQQQQQQNNNNNKQTINKPQASSQQQQLQYDIYSQFDKAHSFKLYFPHNNPEEILSQILEIQRNKNPLDKQQNQKMEQINEFYKKMKSHQRVRTQSAKKSLHYLDKQRQSLTQKMLTQAQKTMKEEEQLKHQSHHVLQSSQHKKSQDIGLLQKPKLESPENLESGERLNRITQGENLTHQKPRNHVYKKEQKE